jgi:hypothetical protein
MARYDLVLIENTAATGVDFEEKLVTITRGGLLTATADANRLPRWLAAGNENDTIHIDANGDIVWAAPSAGHTQNTDTGTTGNTFTIDSDSTTGKIVIDVELTGSENHTMTITNGAMTADCTITIPAVTGTMATQAYADGLFAANDAMLYKGTVGTGGTIEKAALEALTTYNAGWTYRVITAGTYFSVVCEVGDLITCIVDRTGTDDVDTDWTMVQTNLDGAVIGPASAVDNNLAQFNLTTGKLIEDSGLSNTDVTSAISLKHTGNADTGTTSNTFVIDSDSSTGKITLDVALNAGEDHNMTITNAIMAADVTVTIPAITGTLPMLVAAPSTKTDAGAAGSFAYDANYFYIWVASATNRRCALAQY